MFAFLFALSTMPILGAEWGASDEKKAEPWPALVDGRPVKKAFRFKPARIEYLAERRRVTSFMVVFCIEDKAVPADMFAVSRTGFEDKIKAAVEKLLAADDGHVTVDATWVNMPVNVYEPGSTAGRLLSERLLVGELRWPAAKQE
jgi:hypothetical protein